jgi:hypothetical protein
MFNDFPVRRLFGSLLTVEAIVQAEFFGEKLGYVFDALAVDQSACWSLAAGTLVTRAVDWDICLNGGQTISTPPPSECHRLQISGTTAASRDTDHNRVCPYREGFLRHTLCQSSTGPCQLDRCIRFLRCQI